MTRIQPECFIQIHKDRDGGTIWTKCTLPIDRLHSEFENEQNETIAVFFAKSNPIPLAERLESRGLCTKQEDIDSEYVKIVDDNFFELIKP